MALPSGWIRERGRADYAGWKLYIRGDKAEMFLGHPLWKCYLFYICWLLGAYRNMPVLGCGQLVEMRIIPPKKDQP